MLKHARVHTLAEKLGIPELKTLAHTKIHRVKSSPRGELEYARYVYANTSVDDTTLRKPVAAFWARAMLYDMGLTKILRSCALRPGVFERSFEAVQADFMMRSVIYHFAFL